MASPFLCPVRLALRTATLGKGLTGAATSPPTLPLTTWTRASRSPRAPRGRAGSGSGSGSGTGARWIATGAACACACLSVALTRPQPLREEQPLREHLPLDRSLLQRVDRLSDWGQATEAMEAAKQFKRSEHPELLWRWGRICYLLAEQGQGQGQSARAQLLREGLAAVERALQLDPACGRAHQWMSVLLYKCAECDGTFRRLREGLRVREYMETAAELMPRDTVIRTMIGMWYFRVAQLSWLERKVVSASGYNLPPDCLREALNFFQAAESVRPGGSGSSLNLLMLGKTLRQLRQPGPARHCLEQAACIPVMTVEDQKAQMEARSLLSGWQD